MGYEKGEQYVSCSRQSLKRMKFYKPGAKDGPNLDSPAAGQISMSPLGGNVGEDKMITDQQEWGSSIRICSE